MDDCTALSLARTRLQAGSDGAGPPGLSGSGAAGRRLGGVPCKGSKMRSAGGRPAITLLHFGDGIDAGGAQRTGGGRGRCCLEWKLGTAAGSLGMTITPFHYRAAEGDLEDLRRRLASTRWPPEGPGADPWEDGFALRELQSLCRRWREEFDWRAAERAIERWPQFLAEIGSYRIH